MAKGYLKKIPKTGGYYLKKRTGQKKFSCNFAEGYLKNAVSLNRDRSKK
jgi:hypothetical protein